jgi:outer membrane biosynthesis protein TonB
VTVGSANTVGVSLAGVPEGMRSLRNPFQACYDQALRRDILEEGYLRVSLSLAPDGSVARSESRVEPIAAVKAHLSPALVECAMVHARKLKFQPPTGAGSVTFGAIFSPDMTTTKGPAKAPARRKTPD